jgi:hypothetical protein
MVKVTTVQLVELPSFVAYTLQQWIQTHYTGSIELHFHNGTIGKIKVHRELTELSN